MPAAVDAPDPVEPSSSAPPSVETEIERMVAGAMSQVLERQTEKTVTALQMMLDQRVAEMSKFVENRCSQESAALQQCIDQSREAHRLACASEKDIAGLKLQLQALAELVTHCIEDVGSLQKWRDDCASVMPVGTGSHAAVAEVKALISEQAQTHQAFEEFLQAEPQVEARAARDLQLELFASMAPQVDEWMAALDSQVVGVKNHVGETESHLKERFQQEQEELMISMQRGVGQLESAMAGIALKECDRKESQTKEMQVALPKLEQQVDDVMSRLAGAEQSWVSKLDEMQQVVGQLVTKSSRSAQKPSLDAQELERRLREATNRVEEHCARHYGSEQQVELAALRRSLAKQEQNVEAASVRDHEAMKTICRELESLGHKQEALSELASCSPINPSAQIDTIRSIVVEFTTPIMSEMNCRFEALHKRIHCTDKARGNGQCSPTGDPEPEPEMVDLRRLEARQEESRKALEELQQQLVEVKRHERDQLPLAQVSQLDSTLKSTCHALSPSSPSEISSIESVVMKELSTRLDIVSAQAAQCTDSQNSHGSELADMSRILHDMDRKVNELSQVRPQPAATGRSTPGILPPRRLNVTADALPVGGQHGSSQVPAETAAGNAGSTAPVLRSAYLIS